MRKRQTRRFEPVRPRGEPRSRLEDLRAAGLLRGAIVGLIFAAAATAILLIGGRQTPYQLGERLDQPVLARLSFHMHDPNNPRKTLHFEKGQVVVEPGLIDEHDIKLIEAENEAFVAAGGAGWLPLRVIGLAGLVLLITLGLGLYCAQYEPRILRQPADILAFAALTLLAVLACRLTLLAAWQVELHVFASATATLLVVMILSIVYSQRFALGAGYFIALLMVLASRQTFLFLLVLLAGLTACVLMLNEIRSRSKLTTVGLVAAGTMFAAALASGVVSGRWDLPIVWRAVAAGGAGVAAGLIMQGLLPVVERVFGIATAMTLLEYSDVSRPLLRRLATEAPGTFNHSLLLGSMSEAAADAIGANGLLARVGAYYHDVGKINKPAYFMENQEGKFSRHSKLSPAMSLLIILGHVKDGQELLREYGVPRVIWPFVAEHHGTTLVEYFYHAATQKAADQVAAPPPEGQFRYPGPKPQSKETAILMLADSVEGATRALAEPTPSRIEDTVHNIARKKLHDGQLDECNLTLRELHMVEQSLIKSLWGFYHGRIAYPTSERDREADREREESRTA